MHVCKPKKWDLTDIKVEVTFEKDATENKSKIMRNIQLFGNLDDAQKTRLVDIADKCPMHQILTKPIEITTELN
ncbi:OsmC family protein [Flavobacterium sp. LB2P74]|uniref:OsmC family protein n=1 Tax=Flavobacterium sp. LB2P74 TaxID=3401717 RepID=UPI003AAF0FA0